MRYLLWMQMLSGFKQNPRMRKRLMIAAMVGSVSVLILTGVSIFAAVAMFNSASRIAQGIDVKAGIRDLPALAKVGCLDKAQSLLSLESWIERPISATVEELKAACLETKAEKGGAT